MNVTGTFLCLFSENEETVNYLMANVTLPAVQSQNWGGKYWNKLKADVNMVPSWDKLKTSVIWTDAVHFGHIQKWLRGEASPVMADSRNVIASDTGNVTSQSLQLGDQQKVFMHGPPLAVIKLSKPNLIVVETDDTDAPAPDLISMCTMENTSHVIIIGDTGPAEQLLTSVRAQPLRQGQKVIRMVCFLDNEPGFKATAFNEACKRVEILILTPNQRPNSHRGYFILKNLDWRVSIMASLIRVLNIPASNSLRNMIYVPNSKRSLKDMVAYLGMYIVHLNQWQCMLGLRRHVGDTKMLVVELQEAITMEMQSDIPLTLSREHLRYWEGLPLTHEVLVDILSQVKGDGATDKKRKRDTPSQQKPAELIAGELTEEGKKETAKKMKAPRKQAHPTKKDKDPEKEKEKDSDSASQRSQSRRARSPTTLEQEKADRAMAEQLERDMLAEDTGRVSTGAGRQTTLTQQYGKATSSSSKDLPPKGASRKAANLPDPEEDDFPEM